MLSSKNLFNTGPSLLTVLLLLCFFSHSANSDAKNPDVNRAIAKLLVSKQHPLLSQTDFSRQSKELEQLYRMNGMQLIWLGDGRPENNLNDALAVLKNALADGLNPASYDSELLSRYFQEAKTLPETEVSTLAEYDLALSISLLRYMHDLHFGLIDPRDFNYPQPYGVKPAFDAAALLNKSLDQQSIAELPVVLAPKIKQYQQLKQALADYRQQAESASPFIELSFPQSLHPGDAESQLPILRQRLQELGEIAADEFAGINKESEMLYDEVTASAVIRFQKNQGLHADGVIGKQTLALLNQTPKQKIAMIELAMERLRWLPELPGGRQIVVNIPAFQLWAFNSPDDENALNMKVIVGKAKENQTPILWEEMRYLEFMPYWNIPRSIMDKEIMPKMGSNSGYLASQDIELVESAVSENDSEEVDNVADDIKHGRVRARQRPGKKNPLGRVKFVFPNKADVYMHDTPSHAAFNRDRRDLSHGCVRVSEPEKLVEFVLGNQEGWDKQSIQQAMAGPKTRRVSLKKSIPVLFFYSTAFAGQDNKLRFYPDIYGYDVQLQGAINKFYKELQSGKNTSTDG